MAGPGWIAAQCRSTRKIVADRSPDKRARLIDELLSDDVGYAEHWLTFWNDLLRNDYDGTGFITGRSQADQLGLYDSLISNKRTTSSFAN